MSQGDNVLQDLLEVEKEAASIVSAAQKAADRRVEEAKNAFRADYDAKFREAASRVETEKAAALSALEKKYEDEMAAYKGAFDNMEVHKNAFTDFVKEKLFNAESVF